MAEILYDEIPSVDLATFRNGSQADRNKFVKDLGEAYHNIGFVAVRNHFLTDDLSSKLYSAVKTFFELDDSTKQKYELTALAGQRGY
ncbi:MAG: 2-oxoglutarate and iron-dependent oxygenase domain-containing protein, partial [Cyclobacteriaceae bacterium]